MFHSSKYQLLKLPFILLMTLVACNPLLNQTRIVPSETLKPSATYPLSVTSVPATTLMQITPDTPAPKRTSVMTGSSTPSNLPTTSVSKLAFVDNFDNHDTKRWQISDGWKNGNPFLVGWRADHVEFAGGVMSLRLDNRPCAVDTAGCSGRPYASGEYRTNDFYQYGCIEGRLKAAKNDGVVTSLFIYTGPSDGNPHDEVDIEILGKDTTKMQVNYYTNDVGRHESMVSLGFDASDDFHRYAFEWSPTLVKWYVDGKLLHTEDGSRGLLPVTPGRIMVNLWAGLGVDDWLKPFVYPGSPIYAYYDWIKYTPSECKEP